MEEESGVWECFIVVWITQRERERGTNLKPLEQRRHRRKEGEEILDFRDSVFTWDCDCPV